MTVYLGKVGQGQVQLGSFLQHRDQLNATVRVSLTGKISGLDSARHYSKNDWKPERL